MLRKAVNWLVGTTCLGICIIATGCCGPVGCGVGCGLPGDACNDCDGSYSPTRPIPYGPIDALRQWKRSLVCGGGCGEVYYGEWMSTPPDANDPCCRDQFVGGASKCAPFCWQPGALFGNLYGRRYCDGTETMGCNDPGCSSCGTVVDSGMGCASCEAAAPAMGGMSGTYEEPAQHIPQEPTPLTRQQIMAKQQMQRTAQRMQNNGQRQRTVRQMNR